MARRVPVVLLIAMALMLAVVVWAPGITMTPNPAEVAGAYRIGCGRDRALKAVWGPAAS